MSVTQQYLLDTYRAQRLGTPAPPAPGSGDRLLLRGLRERRAFRRVLAGRVVGGWRRLLPRRAPLTRAARRPPR
ncbi:hypothetical protein ABZ682_37150 [Streptomyces griseoviridis]|uniref:hypothetical protein n=1 Tax=Streptomyces griseoviridis TaxID=45398 RepID=UPI003411C0D9